MAKEKKTNKVKTPQDQVGGKVNAGIMDGLCFGGGICENGAEPDATEYQLGFEKPVDMSSYAHVNEEKKGENQVLIEYKKYIKSLFKFMVDNGYAVKPMPKVLLINKPQDGPVVLQKTGYYDPNEKKITIFIYNRNPKDVMRSLAHELIHVGQDREGRLKLGDYNGEKIIDDDKLKKLEEEAYLKGNIAFRSWTEHMQNTGELNESFFNGGKVLEDENRKSACLSEGQTKYIQNHKQQLNESATDRYIDKLIYNKLPDNVKPYFDDTVEYLIHNHPEVFNQIAFANNREELERYKSLKLKDFIRVAIMQVFDIHNGKGPAKYVRGIFRIVLDELQTLRNPDMNKLYQLKDNVMYIMQASNNGDAEAQKIDGNLNGLSLNSIIAMFNGKRKMFMKNLRDRLGGFDVTENNHKYTKVAVLKHEDCIPYQPYEGWCISFNSSSNYDSYTSIGERFYIFLRDDYKEYSKDNPPVGENCPFDDYGMSMVAVRVDADGNIITITTRWNHEHDGEMNPPSEEDIKMLMGLMGVNLYKECPPYTRDELHAKGVVLFDEVQDLLDSGKKPEEIFNLRGDFNEGFARVRLNNKCTFIDTNDKLIGDGNLWFDWCSDFHEGYARVKLNNKWSFIDRKCRFIGDGEQWYDDCGYFNEGYAWIDLNNKCSYIDTNGKLIDDGKLWFDECSNFNEGFAIVRSDNKKYSFIDSRTGELIGNGNLWFDLCGYFRDGFAIVKLNNKWSFIDSRTGELIGDGNLWLDRAGDFCKGYARVELKNKLHYLSTNGNLFDTEKEAQSDNEKGRNISESKTKRSVYLSEEQLDYIKQKNSIVENVSKEMIAPEDVDLTSFEVKDELNPKFWKDGHLDSRIRMKLFDIADDFMEEIGIDDSDVEDIIMTGSLANYNWDKKYSDIDLHVVVDFSDLDGDDELLKKYFDSAKKAWNETHKDISIYGFTVEVYVQDVNEPHKSTGVYSIEKDKWIKEPVEGELTDDNLNKDKIRNTVSELTDKIDKLSILAKKAGNDSFKLRKLYTKTKKTIDLIKKIRTEGLQEENPEMSDGNIIFKSMRRNGYMEKLFDLRTKIYDKMRSL